MTKGKPVSERAKHADVVLFRAFKIRRKYLMTTSRLVPILLLLLLAPVRASRAADADYVIGKQDVIAINVWEQPALSKNYIVDLDGTFTFPMIGRVSAAGMSPQQLEAELRRRLDGRFLKNPQITVSVEQYRSQRVFIIGDVKQSGPLPLSRPMTLVEALSVVGVSNAATEVVVVRGQGATGPVLPAPSNAGQTSTIDLRDLQNGRADSNLDLKDGDTIFVPRPATVFVSGQVKNPGEYVVRRDATVLQALTLAGGVTDRGTIKRLKIVRTVDGKQQEIRALPETKVQAGDTIVVVQRFF